MKKMGWGVVYEALSISREKFLIPRVMLQLPRLVSCGQIASCWTLKAAANKPPVVPCPLFQVQYN